MGKKAVLLSLNPQWVRPIFWTKEKIYEVRKRAPLLEPPYTVYVYCTKGEPKLQYLSDKFRGEMNGLVIGKFTCVKGWERIPPWKGKSEGTSLTDKQLAEYSKGEHLIFMEISDPVLFSQPIGIGLLGKEKPPQSWYYIEDINHG